MKKKVLAFYPFLFAIYPVLFFYSHNIKEVTLESLLLPLLATLGFCLVLWLSLFFLKQKKGLVLALFFIMFFSYGHLGKLFFGEVFPLAFTIVYLIIFLTILVAIVRLKKDLGKFISILNIVSLFLIILSIYNIANYEIRHRLKFSPLEFDNLTEIDRKTVADTKEYFPDIYYIILDRYASSETLSEFFDFDNTVFEKEMEQRGFYTAAGSRANYPYSYLSLASSLNIDYLDFIYDRVGISDDRTVAYQLLKKTRVVRFLKSLGYKYYHVGTWWEPTRTNSLADVNFLHESFVPPLFDLDEFASKLIRTTVIDFIIRNFTSIKTESESGGSLIVRYQFDKLEEIPRMEGPKFVFSHILLTHPPYYFNRDGVVLPRTTVEKMEEKDLYLESVLFANKKILHLIDSILADSDKPPVIVLQADEGPYVTILKSVEEWRKEDRRLRFRTGILNTLYLPNSNPAILHREISPINTFRIIFNLYFGTSFEILEDKTYISSRYDNLYDFTDITQAIRLGTLVVNSEPFHARIYIDGIFTGEETNRIIREIQPGNHILTIKKDGYEDYETPFSIKTGERKTMDASLIPKQTDSPERK